MDYKHKILDNQERKDFMELFDNNINNNPLMKMIFANKLISFIFPLITFVLFVITYQTYKHIIIVLLGFVLGLLSIQLNFIVSHMWAHSLMLEYHLWTVENMLKHVGQLPSVMFYALYHHHHTKDDDWAKSTLSFNSFNGANKVAISHWESFSLFTLKYPIPNILSNIFTLTSLIYFPEIMSGFLFGYEFGVILLPVAHDWVHEKKSGVYGLQYFLGMLEYIGLFASQKDHILHHSYHGKYVYKSFTTSGLCSKIIDKFADIIWEYTFDWCNKNKYPMYKVLWYLMTGMTCATISLSTLILFKLNNYLDKY